MKIDQDAFEEWRVHPMTEILMKCCVVWADQAKASWVDASWNSGKLDPVALAEMKARATVFNQLSEITADTFEETLG